MKAILFLLIYFDLVTICAAQQPGQIADSASCIRPSLQNSTLTPKDRKQSLPANLDKYNFNQLYIETPQTETSKPITDQKCAPNSGEFYLKIIDQYKTFQISLMEEAEKHRNFIERFSIVGGGVITGIFLLLGAVWTYFFGKNYKERQELIADQIDRSLKNAESEAKDTVYIKIKEIERSTEEIISNFKKDLSDKLEKQIEEYVKSYFSQTDSRIDQLSTASKATSSLIYDISMIENLRRDDRFPKNEPSVEDIDILWVDDHPKNNELMCVFLEQMGARVTAVKSTDQAMNELRIHPPKYQIVISDMVRGRNNKAGIELLTKMRDEGITLPVIISGRARIDDLTSQMAFDLGAKGITNSHMDLLKFIGRALEES